MDGERYFNPRVPNPYPGQFDRVDDFQYHTRLVLAREPEALRDRARRGNSYVVAEPYTVSFRVDGGTRRFLTVPAGMLTDLVSVPWGSRNIVGKVGPHLEAAIVHDYLFIAWQMLEAHGARRIDFRFANAVMFAGLRAADVPWIMRTAIQTGLRFPYFAWSVYAGADGKCFVELDETFAAKRTGRIEREIPNALDAFDTSAFSELAR